MSRTDPLPGLASVRKRLSRAARRAGRDPAEVRLVAVTKTVAASVAARLPAAGVPDLGENRVADAWRKAPRVSGAVWHLIGHLQSNKARRAVRLFDWIHSVDSTPLLERLDRIAGEEERRIRVLLQVNTAREPQKHGFLEEELDAVLHRAAGTRNLEIVGLMTMAPLVDDPEEVRWVFRSTRERFERCRERLGEGFRHLSMGMSGDFEVAVEEGATLVRVGRALYEPPRSNPAEGSCRC